MSSRTQQQQQQLPEWTHPQPGESTTPLIHYVISRQKEVIFYPEYRYVPIFVPWPDGGTTEGTIQPPYTQHPPATVCEKVLDTIGPAPTTTSPTEARPTPTVAFRVQQVEQRQQPTPPATPPAARPSVLTTALEERVLAALVTPTRGTDDQNTQPSFLDGICSWWYHFCCWIIALQTRRQMPSFLDGVKVSSEAAGIILA